MPLAVSGPRWSDHGNGEPVGGSGAVAGTAADHPEWRTSRLRARSGPSSRISRWRRDLSPAKSCASCFGTSRTTREASCAGAFPSYGHRSIGRRRRGSSPTASRSGSKQVRSTSMPCRSRAVRRRRWPALHRMSFGRYWILPSLTRSGHGARPAVPPGVWASRRALPAASYGAGAPLPTLVNCALITSHVCQETTPAMLSGRRPFRL